MKEKRYWTTGNGDEIDITEMTTSHIQNAIRCLERRSESKIIVTDVVWSYCADEDRDTPEEVWMEGKEWLAECKEYKWLKEELERRQNEHKSTSKIL